jgi:ParB-like chromosome segregation protein Spo0J
MDQTIELRIVDPKILIYADKRDPRQVPADRLSDAALQANSNAIGFVQPPLFSEEEDGTLTIIAGRRRIKSAIANKLKEMAILVKPADPLDDMRAVSENVVRAPMSPVDLWRSIEDLASKNWTKEAIATAFAVPLRQVRKLRLLGAIHPAMLEHMGHGDMPEERYLRTIASAPLSEQAAAWTKQKPKKGETASWYAIANSLMKRQMFAREVRRERAGGLRHRLDRRPLRPGRRGQPLHDRCRRLSWRAARLARSQPAEEWGNRSGRRIWRRPAPEGRDPGLGRQARQKGSRRALRRPAQRGGQ